MWVNDERNSLLHSSPITFPWEYDISNLSYENRTAFVIRNSCIGNIDDE